jgi:hypothetical protein
MHELTTATSTRRMPIRRRSRARGFRPVDGRHELRAGSPLTNTVSASSFRLSPNRVSVTPGQMAPRCRISVRGDTATDGTGRCAAAHHAGEGQAVACCRAVASLRQTN